MNKKINEQKGKQKAREYYSQEAGDYIRMYTKRWDKYPANLIRIKFIIDRLKKNKVKTVLDAGCGTCGPMIKLLKEGFDVRGFDFSKEMVQEGKKNLEKAGYSPELVGFADLENRLALLNQKFDAIIALGVFPHILSEKKALLNMKKMLNPNGIVLIEFRNALFSAYTVNKYSLEFFVNKLIDMKSLPKKIRNEVVDFYSRVLKVDKPLRKKDGKIAYTDILAKFHNPLNIGKELFDPIGLSVTNLHFYHYHVLPPIFENKYPKMFREMSLRMEKINDWRGYLMASAYVVEARKN